MKKMLKTMSLSLIALTLLVQAVYAEYPKKPVTMVVGFGIGGSADRMTRSISSFLSDNLNGTVKVVNKKGASGMLAANYVLRKPADGYTILAATFAPFFANHIIHQGAKYTVDDFAFINAQWFDFDLIAANKDKPYKTLVELLTTIKESPGKVSASIIPGGSAELTLKLLLKNNDIPIKNLNIVTYNSGGKARSAVAGGQVDFIIISAQGCEGISEFLHPLAVVRDTPVEEWNAPGINEALKPLGFTVPVIPGSIRGYAVSAKLKEKYPERFEHIVKAFETTMKNEDVKSFLKKGKIGYDWIGPEKTQEIIRENYETFLNYKDLMAE